MAENRLLHLRFQLTELFLIVFSIVLLVLGLVVRHPRWLHWTFLGLAVLIFLGCLVLLAGWWQRNFLVRGFARTSEAMVDLVKRPITLAVLDEVAGVLERGNYGRGIASGFAENRVELEEMLMEKIRVDPSMQKFSLIPFRDEIIELMSGTIVGVLLDVLMDARTEELVRDIIRDTVDQVRVAVEEHAHESGPGDLPRALVGGAAAGRHAKGHPAD